jgi:2-polyprenyl-6-hydroxyphenyl methylase/3-demethylubiquinone-9 3-methyltransferase
LRCHGPEKVEVRVIGGHLNVDKENYYQEKLAARQLVKCYQIAPLRVQQYLAAEISYVIEKIGPGDKVLDLGCGFGRVIPELAQKAAAVVGIDNSGASLILAKEKIRNIPTCSLVQANALQLSFKNNCFDVVICIQNGISAFHVNQKQLIKESLRVTKNDGIVLFSSYSDKFWKHRLEWFQRQADTKLLGEIDYEKTRDGVIICKDGFTATTVSPGLFLSITSDLGAATSIVEIDESSIFCEITPIVPRPVLH